MDRGPLRDCLNAAVLTLFIISGIFADTHTSAAPEQTEPQTATPTPTTPTNCGLPVAISNGNADLNGNTTTVNATANVTCSVGYTSTVSIMKCLDNGNWTTNVTCNLRDCGLPVAISNGNADLNGNTTTVNATANVTCSVGYTSTVSIMNCLDNGNWTPNVTCNLRDCGLPVAISNGKADLNGNTTTVNATANVTCSVGYTSTVSIMKCLEHGNWTPNVTCNLRDCRLPVAISNGKADLNGNTTTVNATANVTCSVGYTATVSIMKCSDNGKWTPNVTCNLRDCGQPVAISNGKADLTGNTTTVNATANVTCCLGYTSHVSVMKCSDNGNWTPNVTCNLRDCGTPPNIAGGYLYGFNSTKVNGTAAITCYPGHNLTGDTTMLCQANGSWTYPPVCKVIYCQAPTLGNGSVNPNKQVQANFTVTFSCNSGFRMNGNSTALCNTTGQFGSIPTCTLISVTYKGVCNVSIQCRTENADCLNDHCVCPSSHDFYLNRTDSCQTKPSLGNNFNLTIIKEHNDSVEISGSLSTNDSIDVNQLFVQLINGIVIGTDYFNITNGTATIVFRDLMPATRYNISVHLSTDGVPSNEGSTIAVVTAPNCVQHWNIGNVTETTFTFYQNTSSANFEFNVFDVHNLATFKVNGHICNNAKYCAFSKNVYALEVFDLVSGSEYTFSFRTAMGKESNTSYVVSRTACQTFTKYTVPELPDDIAIPNDTVRTSSFVVKFSNSSTNTFVSWRVDVYNETGFVINKSQLRADYMMNISEHIRPATKYTVAVVSLVTEQTSSPSNLTIYTRPLDSSPARLGHVSTTNITLSFNTSQFNDAFTHIIVRVNYSNAAFNGLCTNAKMTCTFERPTNNSQLPLSNLTPGTLYNIQIFTAFGGMENKEPQNILSYTTPNSIKKETVTIAQKTNNLMKANWTAVAGSIDGYIVIFTCQSPNVDTPPKSNNSTVILNEATMIALDPGTFCNVSVQTYLVNGYYGTLYADVVTKDLPESTNETAPQNVSNLESKDITSRSTVLHWSTPRIRNGIIRYYVAWVNDTNNTCIQSALWNCVDCGDISPPFYEMQSCKIVYTNNFSSEQPLSWSITNLHPFRNYTVYIAAYTVKIGSSSDVQISTLEDIPGKPIDLKNTQTSADSIQLDWLPPYERNGIVKNYTVRYTYHERMCRSLGNVKEAAIHSNESETKLGGNIYPFWKYNISVSATNNIGTGTYSDVIEVHTNASNPDVINTANSSSVHARNATIKWMDPCFANGILKHFYVELSNTSSEDFTNNTWVSTFQTNATTHELLLQDLLAFRNYSVRIKAANNHSNGTYNISHQFQTNIYVPTTPNGLRQGETNSSYVMVVWNRTMHYTGPTIYIINVTDVIDNKLVKSFATHEGLWIDQLATHAELDNLDAYWDYSITVTAQTSHGEQGTLHSIPSSVIVRTAESVPGKIQNLTAVAEQDVTKPPMLYVKWRPPKDRDRNGIIIRYEIYCSNRNQTLNVSASTFNQTIPLYIDNKSNVTVEVRAATNVGSGERFEETVAVKPGAPEVPSETASNPLTKEADIPVTDDKKMIAIQLSKSFLCNNKTGRPVQWGVIVSQESKATDPSFVGRFDEYQTRKDTLYKKWSEVKDMDEIPPYLATGPEWSPSCPTGGGKKRRRRAAVEEIEPLNFIIGNEDCSNNKEYCNGPLKPGRSYRVKSFACTTSGCTETLYSQPIRTAPDPTAAIIGGVVAAVVVIAIAAVVLYTKRTKKLCFAGKEVENGPRRGDIEIQNIDTGLDYVFRPCPVKLSEFPAHVENMHKDSNLLFSDAYKMLKEKSPSYPATAAESEHCRPKNRYTNILPYDRSRVKLRPLDDVEGSDFINANYIPGYTSRREYIATQGPMQMNFDDFWRMIWEQNVDTIVMLTRLVEKGRRKCDQYWPNLNEPVFYGDLVVSVQSESNLSDYTLRIFEIKCTKERRTVKHFWYLKWPDMGCPDDPQMLLDFVKTVREHEVKPGKNSATVVHCSAGVGRTGTYIAVDHLLQHIRDHDDVDIFQLILDMRDHRCNMVQTEDQFVYIHECLKAFITMDDETEDEVEEDPVYQNTAFGGESIYENTAFQKD